MVFSATQYTPECRLYLQDQLDDEQACCTNAILGGRYFTANKCHSIIELIQSVTEPKDCQPDTFFYYSRTSINSHLRRVTTLYKMASSSGPD